MKRKKTKVDPKPNKLVKPKKYEINEKAQVRLISFTVGATIPTMMYGNIIPSITVEAPTIEEAKAFALPVIEELYANYAEAQNGQFPKFMNKSKVTVEEKTVDVSPTVKKNYLEKDPPGQPTSDLEPIQMGVVKTPAYEKASNAVKNSMSMDALNLIEDQIQKSEKLSAQEKPMLLTEVLKKRKEFNG